MDRESVPMITDFGFSHAEEYPLSILKSTEASVYKIKGTTHWLAYELLENFDKSDAKFIYTVASDTWAFGMVIYVRIQ